ncbi:CBS domain-containing protein [Pseudonocardia humida]|uniref:CBS domain-containing protein n=1 Tax=Pseudonocardia humida TaxID=2800819 RepID=A0ABT0ZSP8_9PSEU|nr:CBS domain-containing protein [Pseudonocardia humida]MCO1653720.1 CBS domain-containing protein [Pseudonocardia humida]
MPLHARDVMSSRVVTARPEDDLARTVHRMTELGYSSLPVVDARFRLVGIVSLLDVLRHREDGGEDSAVVGAVMNPEVLSMPPRASLALVAHRLRTYGELRVMPIVERGVLVGVVTRSDLLRVRSRPGALSRLADRLRGALPAEVAPTRRSTARPDAAHVRDAMTSDVLTATAADPADETAARLVAERLTSLPVVDDEGKLVGVVSEADLLGDEPLSRRTGRTVGAVMTRDVITLDPDDTIGHARLLVAEHGLRVVPVVSEGTLVGVLSRNDLV